jgi:hypothetical protein
MGFAQKVTFAQEVRGLHNPVGAGVVRSGVGAFMAARVDLVATLRVTVFPALGLKVLPFSDTSISMTIRVAIKAPTSMGQGLRPSRDSRLFNCRDGCGSYDHDGKTSSAETNPSCCPSDDHQADKSKGEQRHHRCYEPYETEHILVLTTRKRAFIPALVPW